MKLDDWSRRIAEIDSRIRPPETLDEAGTALMVEIVAAYPSCDEAGRAAIRGLWEKHRNFAWAAIFVFHTPIDEKAFRDHLLLFSIQDQGLDTRDAILALDALCEAAKGFDPRPALREAAALSSDVDKYGMGSTRALLLGRAQREAQENGRGGR